MNKQIPTHLRVIKLDDQTTIYTKSTESEEKIKEKYKMPHIEFVKKLSRFCR